jgi:uncharacterized protein YdeI (YjbR/CyaY-like superfamily)
MMEQTFATTDELAAWMSAQSGPEGAWIRMSRGGAPGITYAQALEVALCWGWIDGQKRGGDESSWWQYFSPRRPGSIWSQINRQKALDLIAAGKMQPPGLAAIETAKARGEWERAYQSMSSREIPSELKDALDRSPRAKAFFDSLNSQNRFAFVFRTASAKKPETRLKRAAQFVEMMEQQQVFYPKGKTNDQRED